MIGGATQKIQTLVELAEEVYERVSELREQVQELRGSVEDTHDRVKAVEDELGEQRVILEALASASEVDVESALAVDEDDED